MGLPTFNELSNVEEPNPANYTAENMDLIGGINPNDYVVNPPSLIPNVPDSPEAIQNSIDNLRNFLPNEVTNPYQLGKQQPFGAGLEHHGFERYYEHPKFEDLGFTPFRDNETFYNKNSSGFDDFRRSMGEWSTLAGLGFKDAMGFGDLTDIQNAKTYEKAMAIGSSSREGATGFGINLFLNSGYTMGIMAEMAAEELVLALATVGTGGAASPVTGPLMAARGARAFGKVKSAFSAGKNIIKALDNMKDINKARVYFNNAKRATGNFLNPLEQTTKFLRGGEKLKDLDNLAKLTLGAGSFYRDVRNLRLVYGESSLEGGMVQNQMETELLAEHYAKYDRAPTDSEAKNIKETSLKAGESAALWNMPTIFLSNKIVFDNMFKAFAPIRRMTTDVIEDAAGSIVKTAAKESPYIVMEKGFKGFIKGVKNPAAYARTGLNYFKANFAEGLQETAQEVISGSVMDYYKANMNSSVRGGAWSAMAENMEKQFSAEGAEIFFSGFLMGGMIQPVTKGVSYGFNRMRQGKNYSDIKAAREEKLNEKVNMLNDMYNDPAKYFAPDLENLVEQAEYQKGMRKAQSNDDAKSYYDLKDASTFRHIMTAIKTGHVDGFVERLEDMKNLNVEELKEAFPGIKDMEAFSTGIDKSINRAREIEKRHKTMTEQFPNPFNPSAFKYNTEEYTENMNRHIGYNDAIANVMFLQDSFDKSIKRVAALQTEIVQDSNLGEVSNTDFTPMYSIKENQDEIERLKKEISPLEGMKLDAASRKIQNQKKSKLKRLDEFGERMDEYLSLSDGLTDQQRFIKSFDEDISTPSQKKAEKSRIRKEKAAQKKLYTSYKKYLRNVAGVKNNHVFDVDLDKGFQKLLDLYALNSDVPSLVKHINMLTDPKGFAAHANAMGDVATLAHQNRKATLEEALRKYQKEMQDPNELMIALDKAGMFFDPKQLDALLKEGIMPDKFYNSEGNERLEEVDQTSPKYQEAIDIVSSYVEHIMEIPIQQKPTGYDTHIREKINGDSRSYTDYAEQFGFDPKAKETAIALSEVLQTISVSPYATEREVALAKRLKGLAQVGETVTFYKGMNSPGTYSTLGQTKVDPRYSSKEFEGESVPLETVILQQEITRQTRDGLTKDADFKKDIEALFVHVKNYFDATPVQDENLDEGFRYVEEGEILPAGDYVTKLSVGDKRSVTNAPATKVKPKIERPTYGLGSLQEFVSESMSNEKFQAILAEIEYEETVGASSWSGFIDSVVRMLKKAFGKNSINTALNAAVNIISTYIEKAGGKESAVAEEVPLGAGISGNTSIADIKELTQRVGDKQETLLEQLIAAYKNHNRELINARNRPMDPKWNTLSDEAIADSYMFSMYVQGPFSSKVNVMKAYNALTERTTKPTPEQKEVAAEGVPLIINTAMQEALTELGYDKEEIAKLQSNPARAVQIIEKGISKKDIELTKEVTTEAVKVEGQQMKDEIIQSITGAESMSELVIAEDNVSAFVGDSANFMKTGLTTEELDSLIQAKKIDLLRTIKFKDVQVGEYLIMNDEFETRMKVIEKTFTELKLHKVGDVTFTRTINMNMVSREAKHKYNVAMDNENMGQAKENIPVEGVEQSNDNNKDVQNLSDPSSLAEDIAKADSSNREDLLNDLDDIENCE